MFSESEHLITAIKVRELSVQREHALTTYANIAARLAVHSEPQERITLLHEHLHQLKFAKHVLHPNTVNMRILSDPTMPASPEMTAWWAHQLEQELESGRLRAELVSLFGSLFQEWLEHPQQTVGNAHETADLAKYAYQEPTPTNHQPVLDLIFAFEPDESRLAALRKKIAASPAALTPDKVRPMLHQIVKDLCYSGVTRSEARSILNDPILLKELSDAVTILLDQQDMPSWTHAGVQAEAQWSRTRWRLFLQEDIVTACLQHAIADHWADIFDDFWKLRTTIPLKTLKRTAHHGPHAELNTIINSLYQASKSIDIWNIRQRPTQASSDELEYYGKGIFTLRAREIESLRNWQQLGDYNGEYDHNLEIALRLINAEIQLGTQAYADQPIYILKTDFQNYYPSLNHQLILDILKRIGLEPKQIERFKQYLEVPLIVQGQSHQQRIGVPNHRPISDLLGELVLRLMEVFIESHAHVQIVRFVDDVTFIASDPGELTKAWNALQEWCNACGLSLNMGKTGAIAIRGSLPAEVPQKAPHWLFVTLDQQGVWQIDQPAVAKYCEQTVQAIAQTPAILNKIEVYNGACAYLSQAIGLRVDLGAAHREQARTILWRYARELPEIGSMVEHCRRLIQERFNSAVALPEGWFHWPITAGGLGIQQPLIISHTYHQPWQERTSPPVPKERERWWQQTDNGWATLYQHWLEALDAGEPESNSVLTSLTNDFIERGGEVRSSKQHGLSGYWQWVLALYGPQILERCGSFRFLFTELVPLQLIARKSTSRVPVPTE